MENEYSNREKREELPIGGGDDYREKLKSFYEKWRVAGFTEEWLTHLENSWFPCTNVLHFIELLKDRKELDETEYTQKESRIIAKFEVATQAMREFEIVLEAENKAFEQAGIDVGMVEYKCPICGGVAVTNRYLYDDRYHGLGSGCKTCGSSHS